MNHVVAISGGKDSTAMALRLAEVEPRAYTYICTPTGDELPGMDQHWSALEAILQSPILRLPELTLKQLIEREQMLPNFRARFCTHRLKIIPFEFWLMDHLPATAYVGLRADEDRDGVSYGIELLVRTRYPMRDWGWSLAHVRAYLESRSVRVPDRTDCARCPLQRLIDWYRLWRDYPTIYEDACCDEDRFGHTYRSPGRDTWPAGLRALGQRFQAGDVPKERKRNTSGCRICTM